MKTKLIVLFFITFAATICAQNGNQSVILDKFIAANNSGTETHIRQFIKETYAPELYKKIDVDQHVAFYTMISEDFGRLNPMVYKTIEEKPLRLVVHLVRENENLLNSHIDPNEILVVEIDLNAKNPKYLGRAMGLGALICELKK